MERVVRFERGHDCVRFECIHGSASCKPHTGGSHGISSMSIRFVVKGDAGATQFVLATGWVPQRVVVDEIGLRYIEKWQHGDTFPINLGYHSKVSRYTDQQPASDSCEWCDGVPCYYDGSSLNANDAMYALVNGGDAALWEFLEAYYRSVFGGAAYPQPAEYSAALRDRGNT